MTIQEEKPDIIYFGNSRKYDNIPEPNDYNVNTDDYIQGNEELKEFFERMDYYETYIEE